MKFLKQHFFLAVNVSKLRVILDNICHCGRSIALAIPSNIYF